jgi:hypothetical protein
MERLMSKLDTFLKIKNKYLNIKWLYNLFYIIRGTNL